VESGFATLVSVAAAVSVAEWLSVRGAPLSVAFVVTFVSPGLPVSLIEVVRVSGVLVVESVVVGFADPLPDEQPTMTPRTPRRVVRDPMDNE
jgi:hypothetical protein